MKYQSFPLGIDIGTSRLRAVHRVRQNGLSCVRAVATRDLPDGCIVEGKVRDVEFVGALLEDAVSELNTRERRCVGAIGLPHATLRAVFFPRMSALEREKAARFEAARYIDYPSSEAIVRLRELDANRGIWVLGIVHAEAFRERIMCLKKAGLRPIALEDEGCALRRAFEQFDAVCDVGYARTRLYLNRSLHAFQIPIAGVDVTRGIARDLGLNESFAEKRKRILGTAGAGESSRAEITAGVRSLMDAGKEVGAIHRTALVGNAARLPGLASDIEAATAAKIEISVSRVLQTENYPKDVVASSAPDWTLAASLAWKTA